MTLPMAAMPAAISKSVTDVLAVHGLSLSADLLREIGRNCTQVLYNLDPTLEIEPPTLGERLSTGETLRALAAAGAPNAGTAEVLARVGDWLSAIARAELDAQKGGKAA